MEIRSLSIADYSEILSLWSRAGLPFKPKGRDSRSAIRTEMKAHPDFFIGAFDGKHLVGTAIVSSDSRKGWINRLAVDQAYRNRGIAKALIDHSEKTLRACGVRIFCALIESSNVASQELFEKKGYVKSGDILYFSKRDNDAV